MGLLEGALGAVLSVACVAVVLVAVCAALMGYSEAERAHERIDRLEDGLKRVERAAYEVPDVVEPSGKDERGGGSRVLADEPDEPCE